MADILNATISMQLLTSALLGVLFIQSGLDKVFNWKDNLGWLQGHFKKSFLGGVVPLLLATITVVEVAAGVFSAIGCLMILLESGKAIALFGAQLSALGLLMLFFGQRIAKDYPGAASLVPYFILSLIGIYLFG